MSNKHVFPLPLIVTLLACVSLPISSYAQTGELKAQIEMYPDSLSLHDELLEKSEDLTALIPHYENLRKRFPEDPTIPFAMGKALFIRGNPAAQSWFDYAIETDSTYADTYLFYAYDLDRQGEHKMSTSYLQKALKLEPDNSEYAFQEAHSYLRYDIPTYLQKMHAVTTDFPDTEHASMALYWLGSRAPERSEKKGYYEQLRNDYPYSEFRWTGSGMMSYFIFLLEEDLDAALNLADEIWSTHADSTWLPRVEAAQTFVKAEQLIQNSQFDTALQILEPLRKSQVYRVPMHVTLMEAAALQQKGDQKGAQNTLANAFAESPHLLLYEKLIELTDNSSTNSGSARDLIRDKISSQAEQATDIIMESYGNSSTMKLSSYRGKPVLISYWFPTCGPCHGEFPFIETALNEVTDRSDVVYFGLNIVPEQDEFVVPFVEKGTVSFIPAKVAEEGRGNLPAPAAPMNYIINRKGQIFFKDFYIGMENVDLLTLMLEIAS